MSTGYLLLLMNEGAPHIVFSYATVQALACLTAWLDVIFPLPGSTLFAAPVKCGTIINCSQTHKTHGILLCHHHSAAQIKQES